MAAAGESFTKTHPPPEMDINIATMFSREGFLKPTAIINPNPSKPIAPKVSYAPAIAKLKQSCYMPESSIIATAEVISKGGFTSVKIPQVLIDKRLAPC